MNRLLSTGFCLIAFGVLASTANAQGVNLNRPAQPKIGGAGAAFGFTEQELIRRFDANRNGRMDPSERLAFEKTLTPAQAAAAGVRMPGSGMMKPEVLRRFDVNGDGKIDKEERAVARGRTEQDPVVNNWSEGSYLPPVATPKRKTGPVIPRTGLSSLRK